MQQTALCVRQAKACDIAGLMDVHAAAWLHAYRGIIPGRDLARMVQNRGADWWRAHLGHKSGLLVADYEDTVAGYVSYGRARMHGAPSSGEIFELYLLPEFQGLGFGRRLFRAAQSDLKRFGYPTLIVWALADNDLATGFYRALGGAEIATAPERFGRTQVERQAYRFN